MIRKKHIIISKGGLGNQIFIYYFSLYLKHKYPDDEVSLETRAYFWLDYKYNAKFRLYNLGLKFKENSLFISITMILEVILINLFPKNILNKLYKNKFIIDDKNLNELNNIYKKKNIFIYNGYFQDFRFIDFAYNLNKISFLNCEFADKYKKLENQIKNNNLSVAFCIRNFNTVKGKKRKKFVYSLERFNKLIRNIINSNNNVKFYIFAYKNINKKDFPFPSNSQYITHENGFKDDKAILKIISCCDIKVISNSSSYYWIAAYISNVNNVSSEKKVYISANYSFDLCYPEWTIF